MLKMIAFVVLKMFIISGIALAQTIPVPDSEQSWNYLPIDSPKRDTVRSAAMPIGVGSVASGGNTIEIHISLGQFSGPVDIIFGIYAPAIGFDSIYILKSDDTFQPLSMGIEPWKTNVVDINERLFGDIATSEVPPGKYDLYLGVTPAGSIESFYLWTTSFDTEESSPRIAFEILEIESLSSIRVWININMTQEEFDAIELPPGWIKNQPREGEPDGGRFFRSPEATVDGEFLDKDLFGFRWWNVALITQPNITLDGQGLLRGTTVVKFHEVTFNAGRKIVVLFSPEGEPYVRISRDANRTTDNPTIPNSWRLVEYTTPDQLVIQLPEETLVIRTDNEDSFQGPVPELAQIIE
jgi:hypothetical protein